jgi:hypothetical protein
VFFAWVVADLKYMSVVPEGVVDTNDFVEPAEILLTVS